MTDNIKELASQFADSVKNVQALGDEIKGRMEKGEKNFESLKEQADEALNSMGELKARLTELEQKAARSGGEPEKVKSLGELLVESDGIKELTASTLSGKAARLSTKATISSLTTDAAGSAGALIVPDRLPGIVAMPTRPLMMRDLIGKGTTASDQISYVRETGFTNNAGTVAEGEAFNYSDLKFTEKKVDVQYVGHLAKATRKILNDAPQPAPDLWPERRRRPPNPQRRRQRHQPSRHHDAGFRLRRPRHPEDLHPDRPIAPCHASGCHCRLSRKRRRP